MMPLNGLPVPGTIVLATFTDPAGPGDRDDYSASINWGDGTAATSGGITLSGELALDALVVELVAKLRTIKDTGSVREDLRAYVRAVGV